MSVAKDAAKMALVAGLVATGVTQADNVKEFIESDASNTALITTGMVAGVIVGAAVATIEGKIKDRR